MKHDKYTRKSLWRNQTGSVMILVTGSLAGLFAFAVVAIDGAILMTTKNQLQCAADAAALAGASALKFGPDQARDRAKLFAGYNFAVQDSLQQVVIDRDTDVWIGPDAGMGLTEGQIKVRTHRMDATNDALRTYFLKFLDMASGLSPTRANRVDVLAYATAELVDNCAANCVKPWAIPDRWDDTTGNQPGVCEPREEFTDSNGNGTWDQGENFEDFDHDGMWDVGEYYDPTATGYLAPGDVGTILDMHSSQQPGPVAPGQYYSIVLPPYGYGLDPNNQAGGNNYETWIATCSPYIVAPGDSCLLEPGSKVGPTVHGVQDLIHLDPNAHWNPITEAVEGSDWGQSPRIALVPFYNPLIPPGSGRNAVHITKIGAFFIEGVQGGGGVTGRFIQITAPGIPCDDNTGSSFVLGLHLIE